MLQDFEGKKYLGLCRLVDEIMVNHTDCKKIIIITMGPKLMLQALQAGLQGNPSNIS